MNEFEKSNILVITDDESDIAELTQVLKEQCMVFVVKHGQQVFEQAKNIVDQCKPEMILLDVVSESIGGFDVLAEFKGYDETKRIPVIIITEPERSAEDEEKGLFEGAIDFINKPFSHKIVKFKVQSILKQMRQLRIMEKISMVDTVTLFPSRRNFELRMELEWARAMREKQELSVMMIELGGFKEFYEKRGHARADRLLMSVARAIAKSINRSGDFAARFEDGKFAVLLSNTDYDGAMFVAGKIIADIKELILEFTYGSSKTMTGSIGVVTQIPREGSSNATIFKDVSRVLMRAKEFESGLCGVHIGSENYQND